MGSIRKRVLAVKEETTEGTVNAPAAADANILIYETRSNAEVPFFDRRPAEASFSPRPGIPGGKGGNITGRFELRGSGTATTAPGWFNLIEQCNMAAVDLESIAIGAITSGPFTAGETITGGTSGATATVAWDAADGDAVIYVHTVTSGPFNSSETLTGGTSGATATSSGANTLAGKGVRPSSSRGTGDGGSATVDVYKDGLLERYRGCRGTFRIAAQVDEPGFVEVTFQGAYVSTTDTALLGGITHETTLPPLAENIGLTIGGYSPDLTTLGLDFGNNLFLKKSINAANGVKAARITGRTPGGELDPDFVTVASHDFMGRWTAGTEALLQCQFGTTAGNRVRIVAPSTQYAEIGDGDRDDEHVAQARLRLNRSADAGDDELFIWSY